MKTKEEKIAILRDIITRAEDEQYGVKGEMHTCVQDAEMFMRNCTGRPLQRKWQNEVTPILGNLHSPSMQEGRIPRNPKISDEQWNNWLTNQQKGWENNKQYFIDRLKMYQRELELYDTDMSGARDLSDPLEALRQQLNELIDEARDTVDELERRLDDLESRLDDAESRAEEIENRTE